MRVGRLIAALLLLAVLFAIGFGFGAVWAGGDDAAAPAETGSTTIDVEIPLVTVTETFAEITETVVVTG